MADLPTEADIRAALDLGERRIAEASGEVLASLRAAVASYADRMDGVLKDAVAGRRGLPEVVEAVDVGRQLNEALLDAGLEETAELFLEKFGPVERAALNYFGEFDLSTSLAGIDADNLNALAALQQAEFLRIADAKFVKPVAEAFVNAIPGGRPRDDVLAEVKAVARERGIVTAAGTPFTDVQLETLVDDGYRRQYRQAQALQAERLNMQVIWFQGPDDGVTSEQCKFMLRGGLHGVPNMWLVEEFNAPFLNKLMGKPLLKGSPITGGGHWGCRHTVSFVTEEFARAKGFLFPGEKRRRARR